MENMTGENSDTWRLQFSGIDDDDDVDTNNADDGADLLNVFSISSSAGVRFCGRA